MNCPLLYRLRVVDRIPEKPSREAVRGTVVHQVLEDLFDLPASSRTLEQAGSMVPGAWQKVLAEEPELADSLFEDPSDVHGWLNSALPLLTTYFTLEDPTRLEPAQREMHVEVTLDEGLVLRGFVDRLDRNPAGDLRIVDYKTGRAPGNGYEQKALFQMRFYALIIWKSMGVLPRLLQLLYLGSGHVIRYEPDEADLESTERKIRALWSAINAAHESGNWPPSPSKLCDWCDFKRFCPEFGGTPPELPQP
jgi:putative RecB family exonuclease